MSQNKGATRYWKIFFWLWLCLILIGTHLPQADPVEDAMMSPDKVLHFAAFGIMTCLLIGTKYISRGWLIWICMSAWVLFDEWSQHMLPINRFWSTGDVISGEIGVLAALSWKGALDYTKLNQVKSQIQEALSFRGVWVQLTIVAVVVTSLTGGVFLGFMMLIQERANTSIVISLSLIVGTAFMFDRLINKASIQPEVHTLIKSMVKPTLGSIVIACMFGFIAMHTPIEPMVFVLGSLIITSRLSWHFVCHNEE